MDTHRGFHHRLLSKRQGLGGVLGSLVPFNGSSTSNTASPIPTTPSPSQNTGNPLNPGGILSLTGLVGSLPTPASSSSGPSPIPSSTPLTPSSGSTSSTSTSLSPVQTTTPSSATSSTTSSTESLPTPTPTPIPDPSSSGDVIYASTDGTKVVYITSTLPVPSATNPPDSFLQNPSLEGGVFALVGIVVLVIIFIAVTWVIRKRHRQRLERDLAVAVTFDPGATDQYERQEDSVDKHQLSASGSSSGHGHGWGYPYAGQPAYPPQPEYAPQLDYHGAVSYPAPVLYRTPSPTSVPYLPSSSGSQQPIGQGGANLTRKFSDRKPVPPLASYPTYDPTVPPQFYQQ